MAKVSFVLKEPNKNGDSLVFLVFRYNKYKLKYSISECVPPELWNPEKKRARESRLFPGYLEFNARLVNIENYIFNIYRKFINDGIHPTPDMLREALDVKLQKRKALFRNDLIEFAMQIIKNSSKKPNTIKHYKQTLRVLKEYRKSINRNILFEDVNLDFYDRFVKFCIECKGYGTNTIGGLVKNIKVFMNEAFDRKLTTNIEYKNRKFKTIEEDPETIYLTMSEIKRILALDLTGNAKLNRVRDLFMIGCFSGLRYSDLSKLKADHFSDNKLKIQTEKTGQIVVIPLHPLIKGILAKLGGKPPEAMSNAKMNEYLKELGELAGLDENVMIHFTKAGKKVSEKYRKYELVTVHTARRSFATNAYLDGLPTISIMKITGHRTEKAFLKYIKISQEDNANKLLNHPFFKN
jgi:integrase